MTLSARKTVETTLWFVFGSVLKSDKTLPILSSQNLLAKGSWHLYSTPLLVNNYRGADKSLARPGRKQATATEDFDVHISYL